MNCDEVFMSRCFALALKGSGNVSPNPMVGAVIVKNGKIIGEGYHRKYGCEHAEVNAVNSVNNKKDIEGSTIYVSLEPCSHYGKTPPCAKLLVENKIKKCIICNLDPNPKVDGGGIKMLKDAGIEIETNVLQRQGRFINRRFFCFQEKYRPYIILKYAQSLDGYMDINAYCTKNSERKPYWITNDALKVFTHKLRADNDAFFVGANTVINDNPKLNIRYFAGNNPLRLVYDRDLSIPTEKNIFDGIQKTIIFNDKKYEKLNDNTLLVKINNPKLYLNDIIHYLYNQGINSLVVEGGKRTLEMFLDNNLWDEAYVLTGNQIFKQGIKSPAIDTDLLKSTRMVSDNRINFYCNNNAY